MKKLLPAAFLIILAGFASCKKNKITQPAVTARVFSASYPPTEENNYFAHTASIELKKTDGSYYSREYVYGSGEHTFENLTPGEYWINEETTRQSEKFLLGAEETQVITFTTP